MLKAPFLNLFGRAWPLPALACFMLAMLVFLKGNVALAARITAEKSCSFRLDTSFPVDTELNVMVEKAGKKRKAALLKVTKSNGKISLAKLVKGPKKCAALKGAEALPVDGSVVPDAKNADSTASSDSGDSAGSEAGSGSGSSSGGKRTRMSMLDGSVGLLFSSFGSKGLHQNTEQKLPSLNLSGADISLDFWPGLLVNKEGGVAGLFGLGLRYIHRTTIPGVSDIDVDAPEDSTDQTKGKQRTTATTLAAAAAARYLYLENKLTSELHIGYLRHSLSNSLVSKGALPRPPLRNLSYTGFFVGLKQRMLVLPSLRGTLGVMVPVGLSGVADNTSEATVPRDAAFTEKVKAPSALIVEGVVEGVFSKLKAGVSVGYETYSATVPLLEGSEITVSESFLTFALFAGVLL